VDRPHHHSGFGPEIRRVFVGDVRRGELGEAEVEDLHLSARRDEDVLRLDVAVNDALGMGLVQRVGDLDPHVDDAGRIQRPVSDQLGERLPVDVFHGDVADAALFADIVDVRDVGVRERRSRSRFPCEPLGEAGVGRARGQDL
jgi:hypothetical protein